MSRVVYTSKASSSTCNVWTNDSTANTFHTTTASTGATGEDYQYVKICQKFFRYFEDTTYKLWEPIRVMAGTAQEYVGSFKLIHEPWNYIYVPGQDIEELLHIAPSTGEEFSDLQKKAFATQHLAPIDEALELEGLPKVKNHLNKLLNDEAYRTFQLTEINKINKILGLQECVFDAQKVRDRLQNILKEFTPVKAWAARGMAFIHEQAEKRAEALFNDVFTPEEVMKLNADKRLLISRGDLAFELTAEGGINQLLPNGEKQGWCLVSKEYGLTLKDVLVMKKLILESAPEIVLQIANKRSAFN